MLEEAGAFSYCINRTKLRTQIIYLLIHGNCKAGGWKAKTFRQDEINRFKLLQYNGQDKQKRLEILITTLH